jgi:hypothetical protein
MKVQDIEEGSRFMKTVLLIADALSAEHLESQTNTYLAVELGRRLEWLCGQVTARSPTNFGMYNSQSCKRWNLVELARIVLWLVTRRPDKVILMYFTSKYSQSASITLVPAFAKFLSLRCITYFTNGNRPPVNRFQRFFLSLKPGWKKLTKYPVGALGISARLVFLSEANRNKLLRGAHKIRGAWALSAPHLFSRLRL